MELKQLLAIISSLAKLYKIKKPYIIGGVPRDVYLKIPSVKTADIDITTNSNDSLRLGVLFADKINETFDLAEDGHVTVFTKTYDVDFSSNFVSKKVEKYLNGRFKGYEEAFSRDFTINTLHQDLQTGKIFDPTKMGFNDIKNRLIRTPVPPEITFKDNPKRIYRAINLAARYNFSISSDIIEFVRDNKQLFGSNNVKDNYITLQLNRSLQENEDLTIELLKQMDLFKVVPLAGRFKEILISKKYLSDYLTNYLFDPRMVD